MWRPNPSTGMRPAAATTAAGSQRLTSAMIDVGRLAGARQAVPAGGQHRLDLGAEEQVDVHERDGRHQLPASS